MRWSTEGPKHKRSFRLYILSRSHRTLCHAMPHTCRREFHARMYFFCVYEDDVTNKCFQYQPDSCRRSLIINVFHFVCATTMSLAVLHNVSTTGNVDRKSSPYTTLNLKTKISTGKAHVLDRRPNEVFVHYVGTDKRLDEWVPADNVRACTPPRSASSGREATSSPHPNGVGTRKRRRMESPTNTLDRGETQVPPVLPTTASARRNFDKVNFGSWQIKTW